ncbi:hypothetical protein BDN67DRAFT_485754 [Paxillus ammoniavirescens]|nr:hypothetical protein BDN67DRAFT_485754 [Paxillus ammoniavirescens]
MRILSMYPHHLQISPYFYLCAMFRKLSTEFQRPFAGVMQKLVTSGSHKPPTGSDTVRREVAQDSAFLELHLVSCWALCLSDEPMTSRCHIRDSSAHSLGSWGQRIHSPLQNKGFCLAAGTTSNQPPFVCWILSECSTIDLV